MRRLVVDFRDIGGREVVIQVLDRCLGGEMDGDDAVVDGELAVAINSLPPHLIPTFVVAQPTVDAIADGEGAGSVGRRIEVPVDDSILPLLFDVESPRRLAGAGLVGAAPIGNTDIGDAGQLAPVNRSEAATKRAAGKSDGLSFNNVESSVLIDGDVDIEPIPIQRLILCFSAPRRCRCQDAHSNQ